MATEVANKDGDNTKVRKNSDNWKFPKISIHKFYKKKPFRMFSSYVIKDIEETMTMDSSNKYKFLNLLPFEIVQRFTKKKHNFLHMGLVQVAIKPLVRDGLDAPVIVCLRDARHHNFKNSLLALVESNLSQGSIYFNCFPSFSVSLSDMVFDPVLTLSIKTTGIPLALTVRIVCKAMVDLSAEYLQEPMLGKTVYFHANSGVSATTLWDDVVQDNGSTQNSDACLILKSVSSSDGIKK